MSARSCGRTHRERWKAANGGDVRSGSVRVVLDQIGDGDVVGSGSATWAVNHRNPSRVCITMGCVHGGEKSACARGVRVLRSAGGRGLRHLCAVHPHRQATEAGRIAIGAYVCAACG